MLVGKALNGNIMCSVALRTLDDEIFNMCILPVDNNLKPLYGWMFDKFIQIEDPRVRKEDRAFARKGTDVWDQFDVWFDEVIKKGQIIPIGYDWPVAKKQLCNFFSENAVEHYFSGDVRDIKAIANYFNDQYESDDRPHPFAKRKFRYILNQCDCSVELKYTAAHAAIQTAGAYKSLVRQSF